MNDRIDRSFELARASATPPRVRVVSVDDTALIMDIGTNAAMQTSVQLEPDEARAIAGALIIAADKVDEDAKAAQEELSGNAEPAA